VSFRSCVRCCRALLGSHGVNIAGLRRRPEVVACFALLNSTSNHAGSVGCRRGGTWRVACLGSDGGVVSGWCGCVCVCVCVCVLGGEGVGDEIDDIGDSFTV
jgi:hypothetical protein